MTTYKKFNLFIFPRVDQPFQLFLYDSIGGKHLTAALKSWHSLLIIGPICPDFRRKSPTTFIQYCTFSLEEWIILDGWMNGSDSGHL